MARFLKSGVPTGQGIAQNVLTYRPHNQHTEASIHAIFYAYGKMDTNLHL